MGALCGNGNGNNEGSSNKESKERLMVENYRKLQQKVDFEPEYGFLKGLKGKWVNKPGGALGFNLISLPAPGSEPDGPGNPILVTFNYTEELNFSLNGGALNRGGLNEQFNGVAEYNQKVTDTNGKVQHIEDGMFLFLDNIGLKKAAESKDNDDDSSNDEYKPQFKYCRSGTVPHGNSLMLFGNEVDVIKGPPKFSKDLLNPIDKTMSGMEMLGYDEFILPFQSTAFDTLNNAIKDQKIIETRTIVLSSKNEGAITNTPFIRKFANALEMEFILWLETVENDDGSTFQQLQYQQVILLEFDKRPDGVKIRWPHITVNTMVFG